MEVENRNVKIWKISDRNIDEFNRKTSLVGLQFDQMNLFVVNVLFPLFILSDFSDEFVVQ